MTPIHTMVWRDSHEYRVYSFVAQCGDEIGQSTPNRNGSTQDMRSNTVADIHPGSEGATVHAGSSKNNNKRRGANIHARVCRRAPVDGVEECGSRERDKWEHTVSEQHDADRIVTEELLCSSERDEMKNEDDGMQHTHTRTELHEGNRQTDVRQRQQCGSLLCSSCGGTAERSGEHRLAAVW